MNALAVRACASPREVSRQLRQALRDGTDMYAKSRRTLHGVMPAGNRSDMLSNLSQAICILQAAVRDCPQQASVSLLEEAFRDDALSTLESSYGEWLAERISLSPWDLLDEAGQRPTDPCIASDTCDVFETDWENTPEVYLILWFITGHSAEVLEGIAEREPGLSFDFPQLPAGEFDEARFLREAAAHTGAGWAVLPQCLRWAHKATDNPLIDAWWDDNGAFHDWSSGFTFSRKDLRSAHRLTRELRRYQDALDTLARWLQCPGNINRLFWVWQRCHTKPKAHRAR